MVKGILTGPGSLKKKLKQLVMYLSRRRGAKKAWDKRHALVFEKHPDFKQPLDDRYRKEHREIWKPFHRKFDDATLKICRSISGIADPMIIPEEIFQTDIEPSLNRHPEAHYLGHKSFYNRWFEKGIFPDDLLHVVDGELLDGEYHTVTPAQADEMCETFTYPVVMKPNTETWGGSDIRFVESAEALRESISSRTNVVVQNKIRQHPEMSKYHEMSLNTVRVYLYRSVKDNQIHIVNTVLRMGNGARLDNVTAGGLVSLIKEDGHLHGYALDRYGERYTEHPLSGESFTNPIPEFKELQQLSMEIAQKLFLLRVVGLDLCYDETGRWRAIEINTKGHSIRFAQYAGKPFFGEQTEEVIEYCRKVHWTKDLNG